MLTARRCWKNQLKEHTCADMLKIESRPTISTSMKKVKKKWVYGGFARFVQPEPSTPRESASAGLGRRAAILADLKTPLFWSWPNGGR